MCVNSSSSEQRLWTCLAVVTWSSLALSVASCRVAVGDIAADRYPLLVADISIIAACQVLCWRGTAGRLKCHANALLIVHLRWVQCDWSAQVDAISDVFVFIIQFSHWPYTVIYCNAKLMVYSTLTVINVYQTTDSNYLSTYICL